MPEQTYLEWIRDVDYVIIQVAGVSYQDIADFDYNTSYESGDTPQIAAHDALEHDSLPWFANDCLDIKLPSQKPNLRQINNPTGEHTHPNGCTHLKADGTVGPPNESLQASVLTLTITEEARDRLVDGLQQASYALGCVTVGGMPMNETGLKSIDAAIVLLTIGAKNATLESES